MKTAHSSTSHIHTHTHSLTHVRVLTSGYLKQVYSGRNQEEKAYMCSVDGICLICLTSELSSRRICDWCMFSNRAD